MEASLHSHDWITGLAPVSSPEVSEGVRGGHWQFQSSNLKVELPGDQPPSLGITLESPY